MNKKARRTVCPDFYVDAPQTSDRRPKPALPRVSATQSRLRQRSPCKPEPALTFSQRDRWANSIKDSLIEATIAKDILLLIRAHTNRRYFDGFVDR
jgi:hypothetical protein